MSDWRILTSSGGNLGIAVGAGVSGVTGMLYISKSTEKPPPGVPPEIRPGVVVLQYFGGGFGAGISPIALDFGISTSDLPSSGQIFHGPLSSGADLELKDFTGPCVIRARTYSLGVAATPTTIFFQPHTYLHPSQCKAFADVYGIGFSIPGVSGMQYKGHMRIWHINPKILVSKDIPDSSPKHISKFRVSPPALTLPADALFDFGLAVLKPAARAGLENAADLINTQRPRGVIIEGHTDSIGTDPYNLGLSTQRAQAVKTWLIRRNVPNAYAFIAKGLGKTDPVAPNTQPNGDDNPQGRELNRRVSIILIP
jgi:outer membrane protein OmpA-like peptidoglycan-associated protein